MGVEFFAAGLEFFENAQKNAWVSVSPQRDSARAAKKASSHKAGFFLPIFEKKPPSNGYLSLGNDFRV